ncbi:hypothetical protein OAT67_06290 [Bacteriovoracaceae bacterium]|nr:hypothetical protein [Bacteriovoracaceae bacterium]
MKYANYAKKVFYPEVLKREEEAGEFVALWHKLLPSELKILSFCSPISFRDNDGYSDIWHPWFIKQSLFKHLTFPIPDFFKSCIRFFKLLFLGNYGSFQYIKNGDDSVLGVAPKYLCKINEENVVRTNYFSDSDCDKSSWVLFDESGKNDLLSRKDYFIISLLQVFSIAKLLFRRPSEVSVKSWFIFCFCALNWVVAGYWSTNYSLYLYLKKILSGKKYNHVFCIHELHQHSRILWELASQMNVESISVSHALLAREKLWLHPTKYELDEGFKLPTKFIVNSDYDIEHTNHIYSNLTEFIKAASPRFSHWSKSNEETVCNSKTVLFAGSLAWWDNEILLNAIKKIINEKNEFSIKLRFHPSSQYHKKWDTWLASHQGAIEIDKDDLKKSIQNSCLVVGVGSTVLDETPFFNRPSLTIRDSRYQTFFKNKIPYEIDIEDFNWSELRNIISNHNSLSEEKRKMAQSAFGLNERTFSVAFNKFV